MKRKNLYLYLLTIAYSLPVVVAALITGNKFVPWALLTLAANFGIYWLCIWGTDYEYDNEELEKIARKRILSTYVTLLLGIIVTIIVLVTRSPVVVCSTMIMVLVSWLTYAIA